MACHRALVVLLRGLRWARTPLAVGAWVIIGGALWSFQGTKGVVQKEDPEELMREVVANEVNAERNDHSLWRYRQDQLRGGTSERFEFVETSDGKIHRLLAQDGHVLTPQESREEDARLDAIWRIQESFSSAQEKRHRMRKRKAICCECCPPRPAIITLGPELT
jgi:hypothetical protein